MVSDPVWAQRRGERLDVLHKKLADAVNRLVTGEDWVQAVKFAARFRARSFANTLLIHLQHADAYDKGLVAARYPTLVAGYRQWETLGCQVAKGQRGYMIQAPVTARFATATPGDEGSWRKLGHREKPQPAEVTRTRLVCVKPAFVFDVSQLTPDSVVPRQPQPELLAGQAAPGLWDGLAQIIRSEGFSVQMVPDAGSLGGANGVTDYLTRMVSVRTDMDEAAQVKTLAHELAHVLMHDPASEAALSHRGIGEVEAESTAMMILAAHNMATDCYTVPYVASWAASVPGRTPGEVVQATGEKVRSAALAVLGRLETTQTGGGDPPGLARNTPGREPSPLALVAATPQAAGLGI